ncbi:MAG: PAS domain-containing protein [Coriobacteriia bacterium]
MSVPGRIEFPNGSLSEEQIAAVFSAIQSDVTFVDADNIVRYYSEYRIFDRTPECLEQDVLECHPPRSRSGIERLIAELRDGWRDEAVFLEMKAGRQVNVRYIALRDAGGSYLGVVEIASWADGEPQAG